MKEIEMKFLEINKDQIVEKLLSLGAEKAFDGEVVSVHFGIDKEIGDLLRLRKMKDKSFLTYKKRFAEGNMKVSEEIETDVDFDSMKNILEKLGYKDKKHTKKWRTSYKFKDCRIELDQLDDIPLYMEIEVKNKEDFPEICSGLGIDIKKGIDWTEGEVIKFYSERKA